MSKELYIAAHEELIERYLEEHPEATEAEAYEKTADGAFDHYADKLGSMIDCARSRAKDWPRTRETSNGN